MKADLASYRALCRLVGMTIIDVLEDENDGCLGLTLQKPNDGPLAHIWFTADNDLMEPGTFLIQTMKGS